MELFLIIVAFLLCWLGYFVVKELATEISDREDDRIMAAYRREEEAWAHHYHLAAIETARRNGMKELRRIAAEAQGEVVEGRCREVERR